MKFFICFAVTLAVATAAAVQPSGYLADTPDVAAAKIAHFEEKAKAAAAAGVAPDYITNYYLNYYKSFGRNSAPADITVLPNGYLADTADVAAAKAAHFAEHARASYAAAGAPIAYSADYRYAPAAISVLPNGYLADTPEVASAKAIHFTEHARASYAAGASLIPAGAPIAYSADYRYAPAAISVLPNGYLADTPEVASAKAIHFAEHARASYAADAPLIPAGAPIAYSADYRHAPAAVSVLPNGYLADTPEVASAKAIHFAEHARASYAAGAPLIPAPIAYSADYRYAPSQITVLPNGYLADTPEVAAAKASHLAEVARASYSSYYV